MLSTTQISLFMQNEERTGMIAYSIFSA